MRGGGKRGFVKGRSYQAHDNISFTIKLVNAALFTGSIGEKRQMGVDPEE